MITNLDLLRNDPVMQAITKCGSLDEYIKHQEHPKDWYEKYIEDITCKAVPEFFDKSRLKIQTKAGTLVSLVDNGVQKKLQAAIDRQAKAGKPIRIKIPKARRHGVSTKVQSVFFSDVVNEEHIQCLTVCHDLESARGMRDMFERYYNHYPVSKPKINKVSDKMWRFKAKDIGYLIDTADELDTGRSFTIHRLHCSEVAFYRDPDTLMTGLLRSVDKNPNTMIVMESTANGMGGWWYDFVMKDNDYELLFFPWFEDKGNSTMFVDEKGKLQFEHSLDDKEKNLLKSFNLTLEQLNWRREEIENGFNGDEQKFCQEYPATLDESFITSGRPFFQTGKIRAEIIRTTPLNLKKGYLEWKKYGEEVEFIEDRNGLWTITVLPKAEFEYRYVTGSDSAEGTMTNETKREPDNSICTVFDRLTHKEVAQFAGKIDTDLFGVEIYKASVFYHSACECIERNSSGIAVIDKLKNVEKINLYRKQDFAKTEEKETIEYGFRTGTDSRDLLLSELRTRVRTDEYKSDNVETWKEFATFVYDNKGKPQHETGCKDDRVFSAALVVESLRQANQMYPIVKPEEKRQTTPDMVWQGEEKQTVDMAEF